jgi:hypothetical protein
MSASPRGRGYLALGGWLLLCFAAAALGALASAQAQPFYAALVRPGWAPPPWLVGRTPPAAARTRALAPEPTAAGLGPL